MKRKSTKNYLQYKTDEQLRIEQLIIKRKRIAKIFSIIVTIIYLLGWILLNR